MYTYDELRRDVYEIANKYLDDNPGVNFYFMTFKSQDVVDMMNEIAEYDEEHCTTFNLVIGKLLLKQFDEFIEREKGNKNDADKNTD